MSSVGVVPGVLCFGSLCNPRASEWPGASRAAGPLSPHLLPRLHPGELELPPCGPGLKPEASSGEHFPPRGPSHPPGGSREVLLWRLELEGGCVEGQPGGLRKLEGLELFQHLFLQLRVSP